MEFADITLLECNRQQSIQAKSNNNEQEAIFTCKTGNGILLETGDTVEILNAFISEDGCGGANMEFDGDYIYTDNGYDESGNKQKVVAVDLEYTNVKVVKKDTILSFQNKQSVEILNGTKYENSSQNVLLKDNETTVPQRYYKTNNGEGCMFQPRRFAIALSQDNNLNPPKKTGGAAAVLDPKKQHAMYAYFERTDNTDTGRSFADPDLANKKRIPECDYYYMVYGGNNNWFEPAEKTGGNAQAKSIIYKPRTNNKRFTMFMRTRSYYDYDSAPNVKYYADDNTATTFSADNYYVDTTSEQGRVVLRSGKSWPTVSELRDANAYEIQYKAGYGTNNGDTAANVPRNITNAIKMLALHLYENRDLVTSMSVNTIPNTAGTLLQQYKVQRLNNILGG